MKTKHTILAGIALLLIPVLAEAKGPKGGWGRDCDRPGYRSDNRYNSGYSSPSSWHSNSYRSSSYRSGPSFWGYKSDSRGLGSDAVSYGIRSGKLSDREVRNIREDQQDLARRAAAYRSDGYLSRSERDKLRNEADDLRDGIRHNLNDGEKRRW